jgi:hypothetical protein
MMDAQPVSIPLNLKSHFFEGTSKLSGLQLCSSNAVLCYKKKHESFGKASLTNLVNATQVSA